VRYGPRAKMITNKIMNELSHVTILLFFQTVLGFIQTVLGIF